MRCIAILVLLLFATVSFTIVGEIFSPIWAGDSLNVFLNPSLAVDSTSLLYGVYGDISYAGVMGFDVSSSSNIMYGGGLLWATSGEFDLRDKDGLLEGRDRMVEYRFFSLFAITNNIGKGGISLFVDRLSIIDNVYYGYGVGIGIKKELFYDIQGGVSINANYNNDVILLSTTISALYTIDYIGVQATLSVLSKKLLYSIVASYMVDTISLGVGWWGDSSYYYRPILYIKGGIDDIFASIMVLGHGISPLEFRFSLEYSINKLL